MTGKLCYNQRFPLFDFTFVMVLIAEFMIFIPDLLFLWQYRLTSALNPAS
jgi:hypothetical protein